MKLNNKGFAISAVLYGLLVLIAVILYLTFAIIKSNSNNQRYISSFIKNEINQCRDEKNAVDDTEESITEYKKCYCNYIYKDYRNCFKKVYNVSESEIPPYETQEELEEPSEEIEPIEP